MSYFPQSFVAIYFTIVLELLVRFLQHSLLALCEGQKKQHLWTFWSLFWADWNDHMTSREKTKKVHVGEAQSEDLFLSFPPCLEGLQNVNVQPTFTDGFVWFFSVLHNEVIYLWEILLYVSSSLGDQQLTLSLATLQDLPLHQNELFLKVSSVLCANVLSFSSGPVTFLGFFFPWNTHTILVTNRQ